MSAPNIYFTALKAMDLKQGLSFLNVGSGTGFLSCLVAAIVGTVIYSLVLIQIVTGSTTSTRAIAHTYNYYLLQAHQGFTTEWTSTIPTSSTRGR
jgi:protein-L-isoaspartate O-methyltransferase